MDSRTEDPVPDFDPLHGDSSIFYSRKEDQASVDDETRLSPFLTGQEYQFQLNEDNDDGSYLGIMERIPTIGRSGALSAPSTPLYLSAENSSMPDVAMLPSLSGEQDAKDTSEGDYYIETRDSRQRRRASGVTDNTLDYEGAWRFDCLRKQKRLEDNELGKEAIMVPSVEDQPQKCHLYGHDGGMEWPAGVFDDGNEYQSDFDIAAMCLARSEILKELSPCQEANRYYQSPERSSPLEGQASQIQTDSPGTEGEGLREVEWEGICAKTENYQHQRQCDELKPFEGINLKSDKELEAAMVRRSRECLRITEAEHILQYTPCWKQPQMRMNSYLTPKEISNKLGAKEGASWNGLGLIDVDTDMEQMQEKQPRTQWTGNNVEGRTASGKSTALSPLLQAFKVKLAARARQEGNSRGEESNIQVQGQNSAKSRSKQTKVIGGKGAKWAAAKRKGIRKKPSSAERSGDIVAKGI